MHTVFNKSILHVIPLALCILLFTQCADRTENDLTFESQQESTDNDTSMYQYGYHLDSFYLEENLIAQNQVMGDILQEYGVPYQTIFQLANKAEDIFSVRSLRHGKKYALVRNAEDGEVISFIYEPSPYRYVEYHIRDSIGVTIHENEYETCQEEITGVITSSLWASMIEEGHVYDLIVAMENALAWSVSFQYVQPGDFYKLIVERIYIGGVPVGIKNLTGAYFKNMETEFYSIYFDDPQYFGYYDHEGLPMKKAFLKAPVQYSRISSRFSRRRFHPVLKRYKGHFGTDFAAPCGTPIMAVAAGVVTKAGYTRGNGNYVKIRHDDVYDTQYLHMTKFAPGIKPGVQVKQTDVIGFVGKTGLATGCHVCFRFWKNNRQVDFFRQKLPPPEPMPEEALRIFLETRDVIKDQLDNITNPVVS